MLRLALAALALTAAPAYASSCHFELDVAGGGTLTTDYLVETLQAGTRTNSYANPINLTLTHANMGQKVDLTLTTTYFDAAGTVRMSETSPHELTYSIVKHKFVGSLQPLLIASCEGRRCLEHATYTFALSLDGAPINDATTGKAFAIDLSQAPGFCLDPIND